MVVESDHKPLVGLIDKPIASCSPRIQRLRLQLQRFDFTLIYKPGKELFIADTLSRAPSPSLYVDDSTQDCEDQVHVVLDSVIPRVDTRSRFAAATAADPTLQLVTKLLLQGWPYPRATARFRPNLSGPFVIISLPLTVFCCTGSGLLFRFLFEQK